MIPILTHCNVLLSGFWYIWLTKGGLMYVSRALTEVISCKLKKPKPPHSCLHQMIIFVSCQSWQPCQCRLVIADLTSSLTLI